MIPKYTAVAIQSDIHVPDEQDPKSVESAIWRNLKRNMELVQYAQTDPRYGKPRLIVFSEFCLTGIPESRTLEGYRNFANPIPGPITEYIGRFAKQYNCFIELNTFEKDEQEWPGHVFNTSFIVGPDGDVILKYRKNNDAQSGMVRNTNPGDVYTQYVAKYGGPEALFPVVDTEIGRLACFTCADNSYLETVRAFALRGAEVFCMSTGDDTGGVHREFWEQAKQVRAWENAAYVISVNNGRTIGSLRPEFRQRGRSKIIDFRGQVISETEHPGESMCTATIDIEELREHRAKGFAVSMARLETFIPIYEQYKTWPIDVFADGPNESRERVLDVRRQVLEQAYASGQYVKPDSIERSPIRRIQRQEPVSA